MRWLGKASAGPIGLDIGTRAVKAVQRCGTRAGSVVLPRSDASKVFGADEAARLREVLMRRGITGRDVVLGAPKRAMLTSVLELPPRRSGAPLDQIAKAELALAHRREAADLEVAFWELPRPVRMNDGTPVMAAGCPHADADALIEPLERAGFHVVALDLEAWAVARVVAESGGVGADSLLAVADLGWSSATLVLIYQGKVVYERSLTAAGVHALVQAIHRDHSFPDETTQYLLADVGFEADERGQPDDWRLLVKARPHLEAHFENLARELALSMRYAQHQYPEAAVDRVLLSGGGARVPGLARFLAPTLDSKVDVLHVASGESADPALAVASGLSLWNGSEARACAA